MKRFPLLSLVPLLLVSSAGAAVILSGAANNTAPSGQPYFSNIGTLNGASAIYLGGGWVATAAHVAGSLPASVNFGGTSYATSTGTYHRIGNPSGSGLSALTDLAAFQLSASPPLPTIPIAAATPGVGTDLMMIGAGRLQAATPTYWQVTVVAGPNNDVWTEVTPPGQSYNAAGFKTTATNIVRWGENETDATAITVNYGLGDVYGYTTSFDVGATTHEAQAVVGDSGGGVFHQVAGAWQLSGMMVTVATYENQPAYTAVIGNETYMLDLTYYRNEILAVIPEPSAPVLAAGGLCLFLRRKRRS
ncbi:MAG: hypothetical protein J0M04_08630 [Verrucomicrobia bacterium]|nr:hypothetical protein [Verrucomicrobiota bacterium]